MDNSNAGLNRRSRGSLEMLDSLVSAVNEAGGDGEAVKSSEGTTTLKQLCDRLGPNGIRFVHQPHGSLQLFPTESRIVCGEFVLLSEGRMLSGVSVDGKEVAGVREVTVTAGSTQVTSVVLRFTPWDSFPSSAVGQLG